MRISTCFERLEGHSLFVEYSRQRSIHRRLSFEALENRQLMAGDAFNDPDYQTIQWGLNNTGQTGGQYDVDIDAPEAWTIATGSMNTALAMVDDGVDFTNPDVYLNIWLNQGEIPAGLRASLTDTDADGIITFRDLNDLVNTALVSDLNANGYIDGGDLLLDPRWATGIDDEGNGMLDDLVGWDFLNGDNDPRPGAPPDGHGTGMAQWIGAIPNNGIGKVGVNRLISIMPVRIRQGIVTDVNFTTQAAGVDYAVAEGAAVSAVWGHNPTFNQDIYDAIDRARVAGHLVVAPAGNEYNDNDVTPVYPASFDLENIISATSFNASDGKDSIWNWGYTTVDLAGPTAPGGGTSGGAAHVAGVAALLKSIHADWNADQVKARILASVEPSAALAGKTVSGGRVNAARALATTSVVISDPRIVEGESGTSEVVFTVSRFGDDTGTVILNWTTANGSAIAGSDYVAASGQITFQPSGANDETIHIFITADSTPEPSETFFVTLTNSSGEAVLADEIAQATILPATKFYVVDDGSPDRTYEYGASGAAIENYMINSGNTASRGAASTAAGDRLWVIDANQKVFVYDSAGALLGSWTAGSLSWRSQVQGIATDGTDIWIVDADRDKVFRYAGGANRLLGSQNAASSFALNKGNKSPKDIVTDGTYLWVVDDSTTDKVFKYTLSGSLVGSWTITSGGGRPTGITIDPANVSDIWIVDNATDSVYQFTAAASRTSDSQSPASSFALATGNTNPQGIADPPVASAELHVQNSTAPGTGVARYISPFADLERATRHTLATTKLRAIDFVFEIDDDAISRRKSRITRAIDALRPAVA
ncbi:MAG: S8 family serine peptidase [Pirellulales bacterium]